MTGLRTGQESCRLLAPLMLFAMASVLSPAQTISVSPRTLTFEVEANGPIPPEQFLDVSSDPSGEAFSAFVQVTLISTAWVKLDRTAGFTPSQVGVTVDPSLLAPGQRIADIIVRLSPDGDQRAVRVTAIVSEPGSGGGGGGGGSDPVIDVDPPSLGFSTLFSGTDPPAQTLDVRNGGAGTLTYQFNISYPVQGSVGWLSVDPASGTSTGAPVGHVVSVATASLEPGLHSAILLITGNAPNSPLEIPVNLTVGGGPVITVNPTNLIFTTFEGSTNPSGRSLIVGSQGETLSYQINANQPWLSVEPTGGNTLVGPGIHTVRVDTSGLTAGTFLGELTIDSPSAANSPLTLDVTLSINPPGSLTAFPSSVSFFGAAGTPVTTQRIVSLAGASLSGLAWKAAVDPPDTTWIKAVPVQGGVPGNLIIAVDNSDLSGRAIPGRSAYRSAWGEHGDVGAGRSSAKRRFGDGTGAVDPPRRSAGPRGGSERADHFRRGRGHGYADAHPSRGQSRWARTQLDGPNRN